MTNVLILGANGQLARNTTPFFLQHPEVRLTLSDLIVKLALSANMEVRHSLGVSRGDDK
jgi:hypothetical protein